MFSVKKHILLLFFILFVSSLTNTIHANEDILYYGYDESGTSYSYLPGAFNPYWETTYKGKTTKVKTAEITISVEGFPSEYSTDLIVDGKTMGSLVGGGTAKFQIKGDDTHAFQVNSYVTGKSGERFYCKGTSWTSERGKEVEVETYSRQYLPYYYWWDYNYNWYYYYPYYQEKTETIIEPFDQGYVFRYETEYELLVQNEFGESVSQSGWYPKDSSVSLSTKPIRETAADTRSVFEAWTLNDVDTDNPQITIRMDKSYNAKAKYQEQHYLQVKSEFGNPTGSDWYTKGSRATIQVEKELPILGFWGSLGAKRIFTHWTGDVSSTNNIAELTIDSPKTVIAQWRVDSTMPYLILTLIVIVIVIIVLLIFLLRHRIFPTLGKERIQPEKTEQILLDTLKKRYAQGEITRREYLRMKKDLEIEDQT